MSRLFIALVWPASAARRHQVSASTRSPFSATRTSRLFIALQVQPGDTARCEAGASRGIDLTLMTAAEKNQYLGLAQALLTGSSANK